MFACLLEFLFHNIKHRAFKGIKMCMHKSYFLCTLFPTSTFCRHKALITAAKCGQGNLSEW